MTKFQEWWEPYAHDVILARHDGCAYVGPAKAAWNAAIEAALGLLGEDDPPLLAGELECLKEPSA